MKIVGIVLIVVGVLALVYQGFSYTHTEQDAKIGALEIQHEEKKHVPVSPVVGTICVVGGIALLVMGGRKSFA